MTYGGNGGAVEEVYYDIAAECLVEDATVESYAAYTVRSHRRPKVKLNKRSGKPRKTKAIVKEKPKRRKPKPAITREEIESLSDLEYEVYTSYPNAKNLCLEDIQALAASFIMEEDATLRSESCPGLSYYDVRREPVKPWDKKEPDKKRKRHFSTYCSIIDDLGYMEALVFGVVWGYAQMDAGVCTARHSKMAKDLNCGVNTVRRNLKALCDAGYIQCTRSSDQLTNTYEITDKGLKAVWDTYKVAF